MKIVVTLFIAMSVVGMASSLWMMPDRYVKSILTDVHLLDVLKYPCSNIVPLMEDFNHVSDHIGQLWKVLQPGCDFILKEADAPDGFDGTNFCYYLVDFFGVGELMQPSVDFCPDNSSGCSLWMLHGEAVRNTTKILYGIDINDPSTICPNAHRFFELSLLELYEEYQIEFCMETLCGVMPVMESICQDMPGYFATLGVQDDSQFLQLVGSLLEIGADLMGFKSFDNQCQEMRLAKLFDKDWNTRRMSLKKILLPVFQQPGHIVKTLIDNIRQQLPLKNKRRYKRSEL